MRAPYLDDGDVGLYLGDCLDVLREMDPESVDAVVCDPPYGLEFMGKEWDRYAPPQFAAWCETWAREALRVLKPGGHLLAFGGTRTFHRLTCGLEDAGLEIRDCLSWLYGSGFPKSLDVSKAIEKAAGAAREWQGWGTALKPAWEPCVVARKPLAGTVAENVQQHGTGALNVDGCRIGADGGGRWPANVALDEDAAAMLDAQSGVQRDGIAVNRNRPEDGSTYNASSYMIGDKRRQDVGYGGSGGASRFYYTAKASRADRNTSGANNTHPTVKPTDLMRWLVRLVTPPGGVVLDPFAGSGSTLVAARAEGFRAIGIEREEEYAQIIAQRLSQLSLFAEAS